LTVNNEKRYQKYFLGFWMDQLMKIGEMILEGENN
jgi:hypothetical protein